MNYYNKEYCDRCGKKFVGSIMSWFTSEIICSDCKEAERQIQEQLPNKGMEFEGCGFIPDQGCFKHFKPEKT